MREFPPTGGSVKTAGMKTIEHESDELLEGTEIRRFRGGVARINYLAQDRPDMSYAAKELCKRMHAPCVGDLKAIERVVKYVASEPRLVYWYVWQQTSPLHTYCDRLCSMSDNQEEYIRRMRSPRKTPCQTLGFNTKSGYPQLWRGRAFWSGKRGHKGPRPQKLSTRPRYQ